MDEFTAPKGTNAEADRSMARVSPFPDNPRGIRESPQANIEKWAVRRYQVAVLAGLPYRWARQLHRQIERTEATRVPGAKPPILIFKGDLAVNAGATAAELEALGPELTNEEIAALQLEAAAIQEADRAHVRARAKSINAARECTVAPPEPIALTELLDEPDDGPTYRIRELWPTGGRVLLAAPYKAGKSTLVGNVVRGLVDGDKFLGGFEVAPAGRVVIIDTELDKRTMRRWLRDQGIRNTDSVAVLPLRGAVSTFDILDPATRAVWARKLAGADVVILDCLRPILDALGLSEDKDAGRVLVAFDALLAEAGADEGLVVTHMGHQNERARGDSRLLDWPDALWTIVRKDNDEQRLNYFAALGRDVHLAEGLMNFDAATRHLSYAGGSRKESTARAAMPELMALVRQEPGELSKNAAEKRLMTDHGIPQKVTRDAIKIAVENGDLVITSGPHNAKLLSPASVDPFDKADNKPD